MKIDVDSDGLIELREVYSSVIFESGDKETFAICMRDSGFEFFYAGVWYEAKQGKLNPLNE